MPASTPEVSPSLPPANSVEQSLVPPSPDTETGQLTEKVNPWGPGPRPSWWFPPDSRIRQLAVSIVAMRAAGFERAEIAKTLKLSPKTLDTYVYKASKNGWLTGMHNDAKESIDYDIMPKVVRNLLEGLDSSAVLQTGMKERNAIALKIAEGTVFKSYGNENAPQQGTTMVAIKIEMPPGPAQVVREGSLGGTPAFTDGETIDVRPLSE